MAARDKTGRVWLLESNPRFTSKRSNVYRGRLDEKTVAIKVLNATCVSGYPREVMQTKFEKIWQIWAKINHPNILPFLGFSEGANFQPFGALLSPWCSYGNADSYLVEYGKLLSVYQRIELWKDTIAGLGYLHSQHPPLVHGKLTAENVLIDSSGTAVLCDFGLSQMFPDNPHGRPISDATVKASIDGLGSVTRDESDVSTPTVENDLYALGSIGLKFIVDLNVAALRSQRVGNRSEEGLPDGSVWADDSEFVSVVMKPWNLIHACWSSDAAKRPPAYRLLDELSYTPVRLPHDILLPIFQMAANTPTDFDYTSHITSENWSTLRMLSYDKGRSSSVALARFAVVCKDWNATAIYLLYQRIQIETQDQISKIAAVLEDRYHHPSPWINAPHGEFVKAIDVGSRAPIAVLPRVIQRLQRMTIYTPNLRSYRTSIINFASNNFHHTGRITANLGCHRITTLEISDRRYLALDFEELICGLPELDTLILKTVLQLNCRPSQPSRPRPTSKSLKTLVVAGLEGFMGMGYGIFDTLAIWTLPSLEMILVHGDQGVLGMLQSLTQFLSEHEGNLKKIVFNRLRWPYSLEDISMLRASFPAFTGTRPSAISVHLLRRSPRLDCFSDTELSEVH